MTATAFPGSAGGPARVPRPLSNVPPRIGCLLDRQRIELEQAEDGLHAAVEMVAETTRAVRAVEANLRRTWKAARTQSIESREPGERAERLRVQRAEWSRHRHNAEKAADEAGLRVAEVSASLQAMEESARRLRKQLAHERDAVLLLRRRISATEQDLERQRELGDAGERAIETLHRQLAELTGE